MTLLLGMSSQKIGKAHLDDNGTKCICFDWCFDKGYVAATYRHKEMAFP
tara:strand:- start:135 stop:281 length:147 start_codon:yes stop_codon:yes gene_type:complete